MNYAATRGVKEQTKQRTNVKRVAKFMLVSCLAYSSTLKMEAKCSSEESADFQQTTRHYIPEERTLPGSVLFAGCFSHTCFSLQFHPEDRGSMFLRNVGEFFFGLHRVTSQKIVLLNSRQVLQHNNLLLFHNYRLILSYSCLIFN
jgi:hypothetical protein